VEWAYHNYLGIPEGLSPLLPEAVKQNHGPVVYSENLVSVPAESEDRLPERPDEKAPPERWTTLFRAYKKIAKDSETKSCGRSWPCGWKVLPTAKITRPSLKVPRIHPKPSSPKKETNAANC
jgi:hypothetical protein